MTRQASGGPSVTTVTRVVGSDQGENKVSTHTGVTGGGSLMDQKKVPLPGLGTTLKPAGRRYLLYLMLSARSDSMLVEDSCLGQLIGSVQISL